MSHVRIADTPEDLHAARIGTGEASLAIGCDLVVAASPDALAKMSEPKTRAVINATTAPTADFVRNPNWQLPGSNLQHDITEACGKGNVEFISAGSISTNLMGDSIATNMFMLGYALQKGWVPVSSSAVEKAIELNGISVDFNLKSFVWGRRAAVDLARVEKIAAPAEVIPLNLHLSRNADELVARRVEFLTAYQDAAYAARYQALVDKVRRAESEKVGGTKLTEAVARYYAKLMAYKDEYEVARLHAAATYGKDPVFHLSPPLLARMDPLTGRRKKIGIPGKYALPLFRLLRHGKLLRGTPLDPFGWQTERQWERGLAALYEADMRDILAGLRPETLDTATQLADLPDSIRGFGPVKETNYKTAMQRRDALREQFKNPPQLRQAAE